MSDVPSIDKFIPQQYRRVLGTHCVSCLVSDRAANMEVTPVQLSDSYPREPERTPVRGLRSFLALRLRIWTVR